MSESHKDDPEKRPSDTGPAADEGEPTASGGSETQAPGAEGEPDRAAGDAPEAPAEDATAADRGDEGRRRPSGTATAPPRRGGRWVLALTFLIALAAAGGAGYLGWRLYQLEQRVAAIPEERAAALEPLLRRGALQPLRARIESLETARKDSVRQLEQRIDQLEEALESVRAVTERHQIGWRLAEIRYLLSIAARRLLIAHDTEGAEAALEAADNSVAELQDARLLPLRKAIVGDLGAVREVQPTDIEGIALRLQSLLERVDSLPRAPLRDPGADAAAGGDGGWWQQLRDRLDDFVVIQRRPVGPAPIEPRDRAGLQPAAALRLALQDARRAALARNDAEFQGALGRATELLEQHFDPQAGATIRFREGLADLRARSVETDLPDLSDTLTLARRLAREIEQARKAETSARPAPEE